MQNNSRRDERHPVQCLPGYMMNKTTGEPVGFIPIDVSKSGMGLLSTNAMVPETEIEFDTDEETVLLRVVWVMSGRWVSEHAGTSLTKEKVYRYGVTISDESSNLLRVFGL